MCSSDLPKLRSTAAAAKSSPTNAARGLLPFAGAPPRVLAATAPLDAATLNGVWIGHSGSDRGNCTVHVEIRPQEQDNLNVTAIVNCGAPYSWNRELAQKPSLKRCFQPITAQLSGKTAATAMHLQPLKTVALNGAEACAITTATLTPAGRYLQFEFTEDSGCKPGKFVLMKSIWEH